MFGATKPAKNATAKDAEWFALSEAANAFGVTPQGFAKSVRPLLPADAVKNDGKQVLIHLRSAIDAYAAKKAEQAAEAAKKSADPLLVGADSPALEEYRKHRARLAQMDVEAREKTHADLAQLDDAFTRFANSFRRTGDVLQRRFGADAAEIFNDGIQQAMSEWEASK